LKNRYQNRVVVVTPGLGLLRIRLPFRNRTLIKFFRADFSFSFSNAIVIEIEKPIRIDLPG